MKYEQIQGLEKDKFRRLIRVKRTTYDKMIDILNDADITKKEKDERKKQTLDKRPNVFAILQEALKLCQ